MQNINDLRSEIDKIDDEVLRRLNERMNFVRTRRFILKFLPSVETSKCPKKSPIWGLRAPTRIKPRRVASAR